MASGDNQNRTNRASLLGASGILNRLIGCTTGGDLYTFAHRTLTTQTDATLNDSDKTFNVPIDHLWWIHSIFVLLITSATAGNRRILLTVRADSIDDSYHLSASTTQPSNQSRRYNMMPGVERGSFVDDQLVMPIPPRLLIPNSAAVRVRDVNAVDPTADDMTVSLVYDDISV